jgi:membrane-bound lytic murein transglycosylase D
MKTYLLKVFSFTAILFLAFSFNTFGQTEQNRQAEEQIKIIIDRAGKSFNEGLMALQDNRRANARDKFDKSVEIFLMSGINLNSKNNAQPRDCYNQLIETVYRIEFPNEKQLPQIRSLSVTCGWSIDNKVADEIARLVLAPQPSENPTNNTVVATNNGNTEPAESQQGFIEQKFERSPLDDLATLELTQEENNVETPQSQEQIRYITYAVSNNSLGLKFQVHPMIQQYINYYQGRGRSTMETGLYRSGMFMRMARRIFREEGIPENVAWLGQVESMWKPTAMSWAAASGLWQFIPGTGARFGLRRTAYLDERNSFEQATRASARYLKFLANRYGGNWELAMAAYNSGEGNVDRAITRAGVANFWVAYPYLPKETRNYVPNILATILIANNPRAYGFGNVRPAQQLEYDTVRVPPSTSLAIVAQASDTSVDYLRFLNPEFRTNMTPPEPYNVRVPKNKGNDVVAVFRRMNNNRNVAAVTSGVGGETWETLSNRTGVSVADLKAANPGMTIPQGRVIVPNKGNKVNSTTYQRPTTPIPAPQTTTTVVTVKAQAGDTIAKIAARYGVSAVDVANQNGFKSITAPLQAGREIKIPTAK